MRPIRSYDDDDYCYPQTRTWEWHPFVAPWPAFSCRPWYKANRVACHRPSSYSRDPSCRRHTFVYNVRRTSAVHISSLNSYIVGTLSRWRRLWCCNEHKDRVFHADPVIVRIFCRWNSFQHFPAETLSCNNYILSSETSPCIPCTADGLVRGPQMDVYYCIWCRQIVALHQHSQRVETYLQENRPVMRHWLTDGLILVELLEKFHKFAREEVEDFIVVK